uniref:Uncharacterized protein n=1 Tax=Kalanchoe fedtschenkoi TaxID=63787 RepID=A0A7N0ZRB1_KALFE
MSKAPPIFKQRSWSADMHREKAWQRRKGLQSKLVGCRRALSLTDDDLAELKACIELGFGFDSPRANRKLLETIPALELYYAVNKRYTRTISRSSSTCTSSSVSLDDEATEEADSTPLIDPCDDPKLVKARLKQWAQVVACSVREAASSSPPSNIGKY